MEQVNSTEIDTDLQNLVDFADELKPEIEPGSKETVTTEPESTEGWSEPVDKQGKHSNVPQKKNKSSKIKGSWAQKVDGRTQKEAVPTETNQKEPESVESVEPEQGTKYKFLMLDEKTNIPRNYMINPEIYDRAINQLSVEHKTFIKPDVDAFADQYNRQPSCGMFFHYNKKKKDDKFFDAFRQDWSQFKTVYGNFHWGHVHKAIQKAKKENVDFLTFLEITGDASKYPYIKEFENNHYVCYFNTDDIFVHADEDGYHKFQNGHTPNQEAKYALVWFLFREEHQGVSKFEPSPEDFPETLGGGKKMTIQTELTSSVHFKKVTGPNGDVRIEKLLTEAVNESKTDSDITILDEIQSIESELKLLIETKNLNDEKVLYQKKKNQFIEEMEKYKSYLVNLKGLCTSI
jgi:hypothetical protein